MIHSLVGGGLALQPQGASERNVRFSSIVTVILSHIYLDGQVVPQWLSHLYHFPTLTSTFSGVFSALLIQLSRLLCQLIANQNTFTVFVSLCYLTSFWSQLIETLRKLYFTDHKTQLFCVIFLVNCVGAEFPVKSTGSLFFFTAVCIHKPHVDFYVYLPCNKELSIQVQWWQWCWKTGSNPPTPAVSLSGYSQTPGRQQITQTKINSQYDSKNVWGRNR